MIKIDYYVYYRIQPERQVALTAALATMHASLHAATGIAGRVLRRLDDPHTWMEIYEGVDDPRHFEVELGLHAMNHSLHKVLEPGGVRHIERFRAPD